ncbi:hypothetical protein C8Q78DRAFT_424350 [Trametes maxima]|nr:hypothetical protein C8Q78DRAFT_424350 [Trametes maxima]
MHIALVSLSFAVFIQVVGATPLITTSSFPVATLNLSETHQNTTLGHHDSVHPNNTNAANPHPILVVCGTQNCASSCTQFDLAVIPVDICLPASQFFSVAVTETGDPGFPFQAAVGTENCASIVNIPAVNTCFNVNGGVFNSFARTL